MSPGREVKQPSPQHTTNHMVGYTGLEMAGMCCSVVPRFRRYSVQKRDNPLSDFFIYYDDSTLKKQKSEALSKPRLLLTHSCLFLG